MAGGDGGSLSGSVQAPMEVEGRTLTKGESRSFPFRNNMSAGNIYNIIWDLSSLSSRTLIEMMRIDKRVESLPILWNSSYYIWCLCKIINLFGQMNVLDVWF